MVKSNEYYLTEKGKKFTCNDSKYVNEEVEIIELLKDGRKSTLQLQNLLRENLAINISWYKVKIYLNGLIKDGLVKQY